MVKSIGNFEREEIIKQGVDIYITTSLIDLRSILLNLLKRYPMPIIIKTGSTMLEISAKIRFLLNKG